MKSSQKNSVSKDLLMLISFISRETSQKAQEQLDRNTIAWNMAEKCIESTEADILVIFDCCQAGTLRHDFRSRPGRCFEFLVACAANETTRIPGPGSFTSALIWALKEL